MHKLLYPTEDKKVWNGGRVLWSKGTYSSKNNGLIVKFKCAYSRCPYPKREGETAARHALKDYFRALHDTCYHEVRSLPNAERYVKKRRAELVIPSDEATRPLGERHPTDHERFWVQCILCKRKYYARVRREVKDAGFKTRCKGKCAALIRVKSPMEDSNMPLLSDCVVHLLKGKVTCVICDTTYDDPLLIKRTRARRGFCEKCECWAQLELPRGCDLSPRDERDAAYGKIKLLRGVFEAGVSRVPVGTGMPFWALVKRWWRQNPQSGPQAPRSTGYQHGRHLTLYFVSTSISEIDSTSVDKLKESLLLGNYYRSPAAHTTINGYLETLRVMLDYAERQRWINRNPIRRGAAPIALPRRMKSDRLMTVNEEQRLHAACVGHFSYLLNPLIYLADTGAYDETRQHLERADVNFNTGVVKGSGDFIKMTPRLSASLRSLSKLWASLSWSAVETPRRPPRPDRFWERTRIHDGFRELCAAVGIAGLTLEDIRRTAAWRMLEAGRSVQQVAADLRYADINKFLLFVNVNLAVAVQERKSPGFKNFMREQFGASPQPQNGNGQENVAHRQRDNRDEWLLEIIVKIAERWRNSPKPNGDAERKDNLSRIKQEYIAGDLEITITGLRGRLDGCGWRNMFPNVNKRFPELVLFVANSLDRGEEAANILRNLRTLTVVGAQKSQ